MAAIKDLVAAVGPVERESRRVHQRENQVTVVQARQQPSWIRRHLQVSICSLARLLEWFLPGTFFSLAAAEEDSAHSVLVGLQELAELVAAEQGVSLGQE
jgi:hypothetical protein